MEGGQERGARQLVDARGEAKRKGRRISNHANLGRYTPQEGSRAMKRVGANKCRPGRRKAAAGGGQSGQAERARRTDPSGREKSIGQVAEEVRAHPNKGTTSPLTRNKKAGYSAEGREWLAATTASQGQDIERLLCARLPGDSELR